MKTAILFIILQALSLPQYLREDSDRIGVNTHCYEFAEVVDTPAPKGYKPFYISHYGRHGARTEWISRDYSEVISVLQEADARDILTEDGKLLLRCTEEILRVHGGQDGHLTPKGEEEQRLLAERLYRRYPQVFTHGSRNVRVQSSTVPRCLVSMANFVCQLGRCGKSLEFGISSDGGIMKRISNDCSQEHRALSNVLRDSLKHSVKSDTVQIFRTLFSDPEAGRSLVSNAELFQRRIWAAARIARSSGVEEDLFALLPEDVAYRWWDYTNRSLYINNGNSLEFGDDRMRQTITLMEFVLGDICEALETGDYCADLKFGHDYPLIALCGFLHLDGVGDRISFDEIPDRWAYPMSVPFSANVDMVFYRSRRNPDILVKFVYCDSEKTIAELTPVSGPYYKWTDVLEYCNAKIAALRR